MSHNYCRRSPPDDFQSHQDMYADSYQRKSDRYRRAASQEPPHSMAASSRSVDVSVRLPGNARSFLQSCGLDPTDLAQLAELPEHLITIDTLPKLLLQIKEQKVSSTLSSRSSTSVWEDSSNLKSIKYPLDKSAPSAFPLPPDQVQSWQDRWGNPRQTRAVANGSSGSSSKSSRVLDYGRSRDSDDLYYSKKVYTSAALESSSTDSHSFTNSDRGLRPLLSFVIDSNNLCKKVPTRKEASDFLGKVPPVFPYACILCNITVLSKKDWTVHIRNTQHANSQFNLLQKYPKWDHTLESARRNESHLPPKHSFSDTGDFRMPTKKELSAFQGRIPPVFPYLCVLCNITVLSEKEWSLHITGAFHAKSQLKLLEKYPERDQGHASARRDTDVYDKRESQNSTCRRSTSGEHSSHNGSPSPKRRRSSDKIHSSNGQRLKEKDDSRHSKERSSKKKSSHSSRSTANPESSKKAYSSSRSPGKDGSWKKSSRSSYSPATRESKKSSRSSYSPATRESKKSSRSSCSPSKLRSTNSGGDTAVRQSVGDKSVAAQDSDSDLVGMKVIADKGEELKLECEEPDPKEQAEVLKEEDDFDFPENFENCVILDELQEETSSFCQDEPVQPADNEPTEVVSDEVTEAVDNPIPTTNTDTKSSHNEPQQSENLEISEPAMTTESSDVVLTNPDQSVEEQDSEAVTDSFEEAFNEVTTNYPSAATSINSEQSHKEPDQPKEESISTIAAETKNSEDVQNTVSEEQDIENVTNGMKETFGKVLEVRNLPKAEDYTDLDLINIIRRYGNVSHHVLLHSHKKGFVEMENVCDAERVAADAEKQDVALRGHVLMIKVLQKYSSLPAEGLSADSDSEDEDNSKNQSDAASENTKSEPSSDAVLLNQPVGTEFVRPVVGYFCNLCNVIYASEEEAKDEHCRTPSHREKVKEHKAKNG
ncbi:zinc finger protein 638-like isoform X2 [Trichomycterus rosablanca]|uniref:zinc finger protein 638-like isoform X2 n=1 Tax=Trichomycterus rosablanca TaxID=2290929 RepID=UPI002F35674F